MTDIPIVHALVLDPAGARLQCHECVACTAHYFEQRLACARCGGRSFDLRSLPTHGSVATFTIVHRSPAKVPVPFVSAVVRLHDGTAVAANIVDCPADPEHVQLNMPVELTTFTAGLDAAGNRAIAFGFRPTSEKEIP